MVDQAYFEYVDDVDYLDAVDAFFKAGKRVLVLRTFSKIYGLAALRIGYGIADAELSTALTKTRRAFDVAQPALEAPRASLQDGTEIAARRASANAARTNLLAALHRHGFRPAEPAVANFVYADADVDGELLFQRLLTRGSDHQIARSVRSADSRSSHRWHGRGDRVPRPRARTRLS